MSKHTPGPWCARRNSSYWEFGTEFEMLGDTCASLFLDGKEPFQNEAVAEANARLIAAAPDMYEALTMLLQAQRANRHGPGVELWHAALLALRKAEGREVESNG